MANAYYLVCVRDYEIVTPASRMMGKTMYGETVDLGVDVPESRYGHRAGQRYVARRKAEAESLVRTGNWAWDN